MCVCGRDCVGWYVIFLHREMLTRNNYENCLVRLSGLRLEFRVSTTWFQAERSQCNVLWIRAIFGKRIVFHTLCAMNRCSYFTLTANVMIAWFMLNVIDACVWAIRFAFFNDKKEKFSRASTRYMRTTCLFVGLQWIQTTQIDRYCWLFHNEYEPKMHRDNNLMRFIIKWIVMCLHFKSSKQLDLITWQFATHANSHASQ